MEQLRNYMYMDRAGLDSLLSQITSEIVEENHIQTTKRKSGTAKGEIGFSNLVKKLFKADINISGELETVDRFNKKITQPYESKIQQIVKYIEKYEIMLRDSEQVVKDYRDGKQNFIFTGMPFDTDFDYRNWYKAIALAEQIGYIPFYKEMAYNKTKIVMNMSLKKMEHCGGMTSHLSILFHETKGINISLGVFGHIYKLTPDIYQIKPYAVWRV